MANSDLKRERGAVEIEKIEAETALVQVRAKYAGVRFYSFVTLAFCVGLAAGALITR